MAEGIESVRQGRSKIVNESPPGGGLFISRKNPLSRVFEGGGDMGRFRWFWSAVFGVALGNYVPAGAQVVISQVYGGGGNAGAVYRNDFVELLNAGRDSVRLDGWSVQYAAAAGGTWQVTQLSGVVAPGYYYLVQEARGSGGTSDLPVPEAVGLIAMAAMSGKVALVGGMTALAGVCPADSAIADLVGYGSSSCFEGSGPAPSPGNTVAVFRRNGGQTDTDDNSADFVIGAPVPRNGQYPPLPVQLASFRATLAGPVVLLEWVTLSEVNNFGFYVQRADSEGVSPEDIPGAFVPGCGTTSVPHAYAWRDSSPAHRKLRYRLRQVDLDGTEHFSPDALVDASALAVRALAPMSPGGLQVWPNPFNPRAMIRFELPERSEVRLALRDVLGREILTLIDGFREAGPQVVVLEGGALSSGTYFGTLRTSGGVWVKRIVLVR